MKLTRLYSNKPEIMSPITFNDGLSVILASIRLPENAGTTVHNLGKSTVAKLVDFCLLKGRSSSLFLFNREDLFGDFVFYLELSLLDGSFLTVSRAANGPNPVSFLRTASSEPDARELDPTKWEHFGISFVAAKRYLDGALNFQTLPENDFRDILGYVLRDQADYSDPFHLSKYRGQHKDWKPQLAEIMGLDGALADDVYKLKSELSTIASDHDRMGANLALSSGPDLGDIEALLAIARDEQERSREALDTFQFADVDRSANQELATDLEDRISSSNELMYTLSMRENSLNEALETHSILFNPGEAERIFEEANLHFPEQVKHKFEELVEFNRNITTERNDHLRQELTYTRERLTVVNAELDELNSRREELLSFLVEGDSVAKYRQLARESATLAANVIDLERERDIRLEHSELGRKLREKKEEEGRARSALEVSTQTTIGNRKSKFSQIRTYFDQIVYAVLHQHALLSAVPNKEGNLEFSAAFVDFEDVRTNAAQGHTYKKLLCIAFDLALLRAHLEGSFPRFVFHDGVFEALEPRARERLTKVYREYSELGVQPIISTLETDLPGGRISEDNPIIDTDVVVSLTDESESGRLFKMVSF